MAGSSLDLIVDTQTGRLVSSFLSTAQGAPPTFVFGDETPVTVRLVQPSGDPTSPWRDIDLTDKTVRVGIGVPGQSPTAGTFTLTYGGDTTSALAYNATAAQVAAALNALASITAAGGVTVAASGSTFRIVFDDVGVRTALTADVSVLAPTTGAYIGTAQAGAVDAQAIYLLRLETMPIAYAELADAFPAAGATVTTVANGGTGLAEVQTLEFSPAPIGGVYQLTLLSITSRPIPYNATAAEIAQILNDFSMITSADVAITGAFPFFTFVFLTETNESPITVNTTGLIVPTGRSGTLSLNTTGVAELLASSTRADATLEVEIVDDISGDTWTPLQTTVAVRQDVIPNEPSAQTAGPVYLLESVADGRYLPIAPRVTTITSSATPTIDTDTCDAVTITALATAITSMTTNLSGTPSNFQKLTIRFKDDGTGRAITWGASFASRGATLPTTTVANKLTHVELIWNSVASTWDCIQSITEA